MCPVIRVCGIAENERLVARSRADEWAVTEAGHVVDRIALERREEVLRHCVVAGSPSGRGITSAVGEGNL